MAELAEMKCIPCQGGIPPLTPDQIKPYMEKLGNSWKLAYSHHIEKTFEFKTFAQSMEFTNKVAELAEEEGHHPEIHVSFRKVKLEFWTHKIDGLHESDFVMAAKVDRLLS